MDDVLRPNAIVNPYNQELIGALIRVIGATHPTHDEIGEKTLVDAIQELVALRKEVRVLRGEIPASALDEAAQESVTGTGPVVTDDNYELLRALASVISTSLPSRNNIGEKILIDAIQELIELRKEARALRGEPPYEPFIVFGRVLN
jgi:hypothetical protein